MEPARAFSSQKNLPARNKRWRMAEREEWNEECCEMVIWDLCPHNNACTHIWFGCSPPPTHCHNDGWRYTSIGLTHWGTGYVSVTSPPKPCNGSTQRSPIIFLRFFFNTKSGYYFPWWHLQLQLPRVVTMADNQKSNNDSDLDLIGCSFRLDWVLSNSTVTERAAP